MIWNGYWQSCGYGWPTDWDELNPEGHYWRKEAISPVGKNHPEMTLRGCVIYGMTHLTIDLCNSLKFPSHPELWYDKAATAEEMNDFVRRAKARGITVIPMLNLGAHSTLYLGEYGRMVSTPIYYKVVRDVLADVYKIFERPPLIHIGLDEETYTHPELSKHDIISWRPAPLFYHDVNYYIDVVSKLGSRPWMFADVNNWHNLTWLEPNAKKNRMLEAISKKVVMSEWVYGDFDKITKKPPEQNSALNFNRLEEYGFDQIPTCSGFVNRKNIYGFLKYMKENLNTKKMLGIDVEHWGWHYNIFKDWKEVARCRAELWPEEDMRIRQHFKKLNPDIDFNEKLDEPKK